MGANFRYDYRAADTLKGASALQSRLYSGWTGLVSLGASAIFAGLAISGYVIAQSSDKSLLEKLAIVILGVWVGHSIWCLLVGRYNRWAFKRLSGVAALDGQDVSISLSDEGFHWSMANSESFVRWPGIDRVIVYFDDLYVVIGSNAIVLPQRVFAQESERNEAHRFMLDRISSDARRRSDAPPEKVA